MFNFGRHCTNVTAVYVVVQCTKSLILGVANIDRRRRFHRAFNDVSVWLINYIGSTYAAVALANKVQQNVKHKIFMLKWVYFPENCDSQTM